MSSDQPRGRKHPYDAAPTPQLSLPLAVHLTDLVVTDETVLLTLYRLSPASRATRTPLEQDGCRRASVVTRAAFSLEPLSIYADDTSKHFTASLSR
uniref:Uncharacterized protein n=1 Tax=Pararge aegeria TaxID=116150 RepID=S4PZZ5_9NEOP